MQVPHCSANTEYKAPISGYIYIYLLRTVSDDFCNDINELTDIGNYKMASGIIALGLMCMYYYSIVVKVVMFEVHM